MSLNQFATKQIAAPACCIHIGLLTSLLQQQLFPLPPLRTLLLPCCCCPHAAAAAAAAAAADVTDEQAQFSNDIDEVPSSYHETLKRGRDALLLLFCLLPTVAASISHRPKAAWSTRAENNIRTNSSSRDSNSSSSRHARTFPEDSRDHQILSSRDKRLSDQEISYKSRGQQTRLGHWIWPNMRPAGTKVWPLICRRASSAPHATHSRRTSNVQQWLAWVPSLTPRTKALSRHSSITWPAGYCAEHLAFVVN